MQVIENYIALTCAIWRNAFGKYAVQFNSGLFWCNSCSQTSWIPLTFICPCIANILAAFSQQDAKFHSLFISVRRSTCSRRVFRPSSGAQNCTYSVGYLSDQYCYLLLAWSEWKYRASYRNKEIVKRCILLAIRCEYVKFSQRLPILQNTGTRNKLI